MDLWVTLISLVSISKKVPPLHDKLCLQNSWPNQLNFNIYDKASIKGSFYLAIQPTFILTISSPHSVDREIFSKFANFFNLFRQNHHDVRERSPKSPPYSLWMMASLLVAERATDGVSYYCM